MKFSVSFQVVVQLIMATVVAGFSQSSSFSGSSVGVASLTASSSITMEYIPSGMSKAQYEKLKAKEQKKASGKNLGKVGITTFKSRSFDDWQKSGGKNLFPVDPRSVKNQKELPYMQRPGGAADDSDLGGKKGGFFGMFGVKKKEETSAPVDEKKTNWWTLN
mmetsp:Transcript_6838/g.17625  ORF Transcript_6838/g.17625 Transcript_6838/m.17625 type:complete len:162 (-) Transcript_6838:2323-2808(-)